MHTVEVWGKQATLASTRPPALHVHSPPHPQVDMSKVSLDTIKPWITQRVTELLGFEDDVVIEFVFNLLENNQVGRHAHTCMCIHRHMSTCNERNVCVDTARCTPFLSMSR